MKFVAKIKQKHSLLSGNYDPATNFPAGGYPIATRLNASRSVLLPSVDTLSARAKEDSLADFKTQENICEVEPLLATYRGDKSTQKDSIKDKELARLDRDSLLHIINTRRAPSNTPSTPSVLGTTKPTAPSATSSSCR